MDYPEYAYVVNKLEWTGGDLILREHVVFLFSTPLRYGWYIQLAKWWTGGDLNPWPLPCEGSDLPADLPARRERSDRRAGRESERNAPADLPAHERP